MHEGSCLCGAVTFEVDRALPKAIACHCTMCRKQSSHYFVSVELPRDSLTIHAPERLTWYASSDKARRGFCATCGSALFWDPIRGDKIGVSMGAMNAPTETQMGIHIFVADKGDYYDITDGLPQNPR